MGPKVVYEFGSDRKFRKSRKVIFYLLTSVRVEMWYFPYNFKMALYESK